MLVHFELNKNENNIFDWSESKAQEGTESDKLLDKKKSHKLI